VGATAQASFAPPRRGGKTIAHGVSRGHEMPQEHQSPGGAKEPVAPFGGWEVGGRCALPRLTPWATLFGPCRGRAGKPCRAPCRRFPHFGVDRVSRNVLILSHAACEEGGRSAKDARINRGMGRKWLRPKGLPQPWQMDRRGVIRTGNQSSASYAGTCNHCWRKREGG